MMQQLHHRYSEQAREKIIKVLSRNPSSVVAYDDLFTEAMAFPVVSREDLNDWLRELPHVEIKLNGFHRKKPLLFKGDRVAIINSEGLHELLAKIKKSDPG